MDDIETIESTYVEKENGYEGFCTSCQDWTRLQTEADAEGYDCPQCEQNTVVGALSWFMEAI